MWHEYAHYNLLNVIDVVMFLVLVTTLFVTNLKYCLFYKHILVYLPTCHSLGIHVHSRLILRTWSGTQPNGSHWLVIVVSSRGWWRFHQSKNKPGLVRSPLNKLTNWRRDGRSIIVNNIHIYMHHLYGHILKLCGVGWLHTYLIFYFMFVQEDPNALLEDLDKPGMDEEPIGVQPRWDCRVDT